MRKNIVILGSTGSIGQSALSVLRRLKDRYRVVGLSAHHNWRRLLLQAKEFEAAQVALADAQAAQEMSQHLDDASELLIGSDATTKLVAQDDVDMVLCGIAGASALEPVVEAIRTGKTVALANKEVMVMAGGIITRLSRRHGAEIIPIDSEHSGIFQALRSGRPSEVKKITLTASGGPFYELPTDKLASVTPSEALNHPTWQMGKKITIDSATLMNKTLEVVEAKWLFDLEPSQIEILIHPQSICHGLVTFCDGSIMAQMGSPDMRTPIQYALTHPERLPAPTELPDLQEIGSLTFLPPDLEKFPCLQLGHEVAEKGGTTGAVLSAADEVAVELFLEQKIRFTDIYALVRGALDAHESKADPDLADVLEAAAWAREHCLNLARERG